MGISHYSRMIIGSTGVLWRSGYGRIIVDINQGFASILLNGWLGNAMHFLFQCNCWPTLTMQSLILHDIYADA